MEKITLALIDNNLIYLRALCQEVQKDKSLKILFQTKNGILLMDELSRLKEHPQIVVMEIDFAKSDGFEIAKKLNFYYPQIKIIIMSDYHNDDLVMKAMRLGVRAYIDKMYAFHCLSYVIKTVMKSDYFFNEIFNINCFINEKKGN